MKKKQTKREKYKVLLRMVLVLRIIHPFFLFSYPILTTIAGLILDQIDGQLFFESGYTWEVYNRIDKALDYWLYVFIIIFFATKIQYLLPIALVLLAYRTIGQILGIVYSKESAYLLFPNVFQWFFILVLVVPTIHTSTALLLSIGWGIFIETLIHYKNIFPISKYVFRHEIIWKKDRKTI